MFRPCIVGHLSLRIFPSGLLHLLVGLLFTAPVFAGHYELVKEDDPGGRGYVYGDVAGGVCEAYEKNLARFENEPYGMACGRKLDPTLGFTRPSWEKLDISRYANLVHEIFF